MALPTLPLLEFGLLGTTRLLVPGILLLGFVTVATTLAAITVRTSWLWPFLFLGLTMVSVVVLPGYLAVRSRLMATPAPPGTPSEVEATGEATRLELGGAALEGEMGTAPLPLLDQVVPFSADQASLVEALGQPDQFLVAVDPASGTRAELWTWYRARGGGRAPGRLLGTSNLRLPERPIAGRHSCPAPDDRVRPDGGALRLRRLLDRGEGAGQAR